MRNKPLPGMVKNSPLHKNKITSYTTDPTVKRTSSKPRTEPYTGPKTITGKPYIGGTVPGASKTRTIGLVKSGLEKLSKWVKKK